MNAPEKLINAGFDDVVYLVNYSYDDALIGVSDDNRAIYDYNKMVEWLVTNSSFEIISISPLHQIHSFNCQFQ